MKFQFQEYPRVIGDMRVELSILLNSNQNISVAFHNDVIQVKAKMLRAYRQSFSTLIRRC